jgi:hypothetical protein
MDTVEEVLEHFGVKGMKWGVRKDAPSGPQPVTIKAEDGKRVKTAGGTGQPASEDAKKVAIAKQTAKASSTDALSTKELQELVNRMNLEQQYSKLAASGGSVALGRKFAKNVAVNVGSQSVKDASAKKVKAVAIAKGLAFVL